MKRITEILILIVLLVTLTSCKDAPHRELFNELYDNNFKAAEYLADEVMDYYAGYDFYVVNITKITEGSRYEDWLKYEALEYEGIDRVIISKLRDDDYKAIDIIEFESVEYAEKMMAEVNTVNVNFARYENIVYNLEEFGIVFVYGELKLGSIIYNSEKNVLCEVTDFRYKAEKLVIQDSVEYIAWRAIRKHSYIKEIICGENLEKIGTLAMTKMENLEYFEANAKLKAIGIGVFGECPKLKTVVLNDGLEYIGVKAFYDCPSLEYVVIPESVKYIEYEAFTSGTLYCEIESKPDGWDDDFVTDNVKVYWGNEWEYNEEGIPVLIKE